MQLEGLRSTTSCRDFIKLIVVLFVRDVGIMISVSCSGGCLKAVASGEEVGRASGVALARLTSSTGVDHRRVGR